jgi:hypothetical protein
MKCFIHLLNKAKNKLFINNKRMSAGGLSYSGLVNHGKITLPSVGNWGTNMNILRDPHKSITTRRIDKVGDTNFITETIDDSGGRINEAIQVYARGVNPSVSVSYNNYSNNGGQKSGGIVEGGGRSAKLPYPIMKDGAFRPPILLQEDLFPLSRLPRQKTNASSNSGFTDFSRKLKTPGTAEETKEVKNHTIKGHVRPTAVYKIEPQSQKPFEVKYVIQPFIKRSVGSGTRTMDITNQHVGNPTKEVNNDVRHTTARSNLTDNRYVNNNEFHSARFIQEYNSHPVVSNASSSNNYNSANTEVETNRFMQDNLNYSVTSNMYDKNNYNSENTQVETNRFMQDTLVHPVVSNIYDKNNYNSENTQVETNRFMQDHLNYPVTSNIYDKNNYNSENTEVETNRFMQDNLNYSVTSNIYDKNNYNSENTEVETNRFMQDNLNYPVTSNIYDKNNYNSENTEFETGRFMQNTLVHPVVSNVSSRTNYNSDNTELDSSRFVQNTLVHPVTSNISSNVRHTSIEDIFDLSDMPVHNKIIHVNINAPVSGVEQTKYFHNDIILSRTLPEYTVKTNVSNQKTYKQPEYDNQIELSRNTPKTSYITNNIISPGSSDHSSRKVNLPQKISPGSFDIRAQIPMTGRMQDVDENKKESEKAKMNRIVMENRNIRYQK